jgi:hypothetical protein
MDGKTGNGIPFVDNFIHLCISICREMFGGSWVCTWWWTGNGWKNGKWNTICRKLEVRGDEQTIWNLENTILFLKYRFAGREIP